MKRIQRGFTMIELLIVIAVLGILAVAVLAAINPIEQINRGRDTGSRSDSEQLIGAVDRFYTVNGFYPWQLSATDVAGIATGWEAVGAGWQDSGGTVVLDKLTSTGTAEIKASFQERISAATYNTLYVYNDGQQGSSTYVCFLPKSQNFLTESNARCTAGTPGDYPAEACPGGGADSYSCLP